ncbi:MAG: hypothetical protein R2684_15885 [Pyrinomonadaceae bacterium]
MFVEPKEPDDGSVNSQIILDMVISVTTLRFNDAKYSMKTKIARAPEVMLLEETNGLTISTEGFWIDFHRIGGNFNFEGKQVKVRDLLNELAKHAGSQIWIIGETHEMPGEHFVSL